MVLVVATIALALVLAVRISVAVGGRVGRTAARLVAAAHRLFVRSGWLGRATQLAGWTFLVGWLVIPARDSSSTYYTVRVDLLVALLTTFAAGCIVLLAQPIRRYVHRHRTDAEAWRAVDELLDHASRGGYELVIVEDVVRVTHAGTTATVVHTTGGNIETAWWPGQRVEVGTLVVAERSPGSGLRSVRSVGPQTLRAARCGARSNGETLDLSLRRRTSLAQDARTLLGER